MFLVVRTPRKTVGLVSDIKERRERLESPLPVYCGNSIGITVEIEDSRDKPFGFPVLKPSGVRFVEVSFRNYLVNGGYKLYGCNWGYLGLDLSGLCITGVVASRAKWRFDGDQVKSMKTDRPIKATRAAVIPM